jgi:hypothetical protein
MKAAWTMAAIVCLATHPSARASRIAPLDLEKLAPQSQVIVVGTVTAITDSDAESDTISVRVVSVIKGGSDVQSFSLRLRNKGVKDFDPRLVAGDQGVFFLKSIKDGRAELTYWGSIATLPKSGNFTVHDKSGDAPKAPATPGGDK